MEKNSEKDEKKGTKRKRADNYGIEIYDNDSVYEGEFLNGVPHGKGKLEKNNICVYEGDFFNGVAHGKGKVETKNFIYEGDFFNSAKHGLGEFVYKSSGTKYTGIFKNNHARGFLKITWANGSTFESIFYNISNSKTGKFTYSSGKTCNAKCVNHKLIIVKPENPSPPAE